MMVVSSELQQNIVVIFKKSEARISIMQLSTKERQRAVDRPVVIVIGSCCSAAVKAGANEDWENDLEGCG